MGVLLDWRCSCGFLWLDLRSSSDNPPKCLECKKKMHVTWESGVAPTTDLYSAPVYSDATGEYHTSTRDKERAMRELGYHAAGDKVRGARPDLSIQGTGFSYRDQGNRQSTAERAKK